MMMFPFSFSLLKVVGLLVLSFFVLLAVSKTGSKGLRGFGKILAVILWIMAAWMVVTIVYRTVTCGYQPGEMRWPKSKYFLEHKMKK